MQPPSSIQKFLHTLSFERLLQYDAIHMSVPPEGTSAWMASLMGVGGPEMSALYVSENVNQRKRKSWLRLINSIVQILSIFMNLFV